MKPICFMITPCGKNATQAEVGQGVAIQFNALWDRAFAPVIKEHGYDPVRADQDVGALIIRQMIERLISPISCEAFGQLGRRLDLGHRVRRQTAGGRHKLWRRSRRRTPSLSPTLAGRSRGLTREAGQYQAGAERCLAVARAKAKQLGGRNKLAAGLNVSGPSLWRVLKAERPDDRADHYEDERS